MKALAISTVLCAALVASSCSSKAPAPPKEAAESAADTQVQPDGPSARVSRAAVPIERPEESTPVQVRLYRRAVTDGILEAREFQVTSEAEANIRRQKAASEGWKPWPPRPAPQFAWVLAEAHPELTDCPFLLRVSEDPKDLLHRPPAHIKCYRTVTDVNVVVEREFTIQQRHELARPCLELRTVPETERYTARIRELRERCRRMGVVTGAPR